MDALAPLLMGAGTYLMWYSARKWKAGQPGPISKLRDLLVGTSASKSLVGASTTAVRPPGSEVFLPAPGTNAPVQGAAPGSEVFVSSP